MLTPPPGEVFVTGREVLDTLLDTVLPAADQQFEHAYSHTYGMTVKDSLLYTTCVVTCIICDSPHIMVCTIEVRVYTSIRYLVRYDLGDVLLLASLA